MNQLVAGGGAVVRRVVSRVGHVLRRENSPQTTRARLFENPGSTHTFLGFEFMREKTQLGRSHCRRAPLRFVQFAPSFEIPWPYVQEEVVRMTHAILPGYAEALRLLKTGPLEELRGRTICFFGTEGFPSRNDKQSLFPVVVSDDWIIKWLPKSLRLDPQRICVATFT